VLCQKYFVLKAAILILLVKCLIDTLLRLMLPLDNTDSANNRFLFPGAVQILKLRQAEICSFCVSLISYKSKTLCTSICLKTAVCSATVSLITLSFESTLNSAIVSYRICYQWFKI